MTQFIIPETELVRQHGLKREIFARMRRESQVVTKGEDWLPILKVICYTREGAEKVAAKIGKSIPPAVPPTPLQTEEVRVIKSTFPNRNIILTERTCGEQVFVRVRSADNYKLNLTNGKPMTLTAALSGGHWIRVGRDPRYPGRW